MFGKRTVLVALMATTLVLAAVAVASATLPSGLANVLIGRGQASRSFEAHQRKGNVVLHNDPDLFWDGSGSGNRFRHNRCRTSDPAGLCSH